MAGLFTLHGLGNSGIIKSTIKPENKEVQMEVFEIETERLQLRQFRVEDAQDVFAIFSDEQTTLDCGGYHAFDAMDEE